jgi:hypothetical protein
MPKINIRRLDIRLRGVPAAAAGDARDLKPALEKALAKALSLTDMQTSRVQSIDLGTVRASAADWPGQVAGKLADRLGGKTK